MEKMIKIERRRNSPYVLNFKNNGNLKRYEWSGSKGIKIDTKELPEDVVNYLLMTSRCFTDGELKIVKDSEIAEELISNIDDIEKYENNTHTRKEIVKILEGNTNSMKKELSKITVSTEKSFVIDVAKEINLDSATKREFLASWMNVPSDVLFTSDED
jgi:hypothetical protein